VAPIPHVALAAPGLGSRGCRGLLAVALIAVLVSTARDGSSPLLPAALVGLAALMAIRPADGLVAAAGLLSFGAVLNAFVDGPYSWTEPLAAAVLAGWLARTAIRPRALHPTRLAGPALVLAALVFASAAVALAIVQARTEFVLPFLHAVGRYVTTGFFRQDLDLRALNDAFSLLVGIGIAWAAAEAIAADPLSARRCTRMLVASTAAIAVLSVLQLVSAAIVTGDTIGALRRMLPSVRLSPAFRDYNAAGSYLAFGLAAAVLAPLPSGWRRLVRFALAGALGAGLWLTGSRVALGSAALVITIVAAPRLFVRYRFRPRRFAGTAAIAATACLLVAIAMARPRADDERATPARSFALRVELARTALRMTASAPIFGVGIGRYIDRSMEFSDESLPPRYRRQNAHNNFLQVTGELGVAGLAAFLWLLVVALRQAWHSLGGTSPDDRWNAALLAGLGVFVITWAGGHPLLIPEVAVPFWLALGIACGYGEAAAPLPDAPRARPWVAPLAALVILLLVAPRVGAELRASDFEHMGIGFGPWHVERSGRRFRETRTPAVVFVPSDAGQVEIALSVRGHQPQLVDLVLEGQLANRVRVPPRRWVKVSLVVPHRSRRYQRLELRMGDPAADEDGPTLLVGRVNQRG
jgi:O-antigen ligase